jgi:predicted Zn-ribbon and HTH transcriptional regulator
MSVVPEPSPQIRSENGSALGGAKGPLRCATCGYEIVSYRSLPSCPMCRGASWEPAPWRPFTRHRS